MSTRHRILLVDDNPSVLETYQALLEALPSHPEIKTAGNGPRALAMLEDQPYRLLVCDLMMPKMDGLQVLSIARRKHPQLRTVALSSVVDEQFRSRVYAVGVDLFWTKPDNERETRMFLECLESLLGQDTDSGFRGVQSKSLVDIIQLECMSQSSAVLRITNSSHSGKIWIQDGEVIDSETEDLRGEPAFQKIFSWRAGTFEMLPAEVSRPRTIFKPYNGLLLESAQVLDEAQDTKAKANGNTTGPLARLAEVEGVEFLLAMGAGEQPPVTRGLENPGPMGTWAQRSLRSFRKLGERLQVGEVGEVIARGPQRQVILTSEHSTEFCVGWKNTMSLQQMREMMKKVLGLWAS